MIEFAGALPGQTIRLTFTRSEFSEPNCVLVFAFFAGKLVLARHNRRGWEIPGGRMEPGEWPIQTAIREVYEETGGEVSELEPIGQYRIMSPDHPDWVKTIYAARLSNIHPLPVGSEITETKVVDELPDPDKLLADPAVSPLLKDDVYRLTLPNIHDHRYAQ